MAVKTQSEKSKLKRARSWAKNQAAKIVRKDEQAAREEHNRKVGSTGKQRWRAANKQAKQIDIALATEEE